MTPRVARTGAPVLPLLRQVIKNGFGFLDRERLAQACSGPVSRRNPFHMFLLQTCEDNYRRPPFATVDRFYQNHWVSLGMGIDDHNVNIIEIVVQNPERVVGSRR